MRKLDDIIPPSRRTRDDNQDLAPSSAPATFAPAPGEPPRYIAGSKKRFPWVASIVAVVIIGGALGALLYFSGARVEVTPATSMVTAQGSYTAAGSAGELTYTIISAQKVASASAPMTGTKQVSSVASGTITIYNTQSKSERLITNTRFATESGLIFRIHSAVSIPAGSTAKPGSATATVYADKPGSQYNVGPSAFTVPGLAGSPQFAEVTARSTSAITGGASGTVPVVDASAEAATRATLSTTLAKDLEAALKDQVPAGAVLIPGAATTSYVSLQSEAGADANTALIKEQGTITAVVFPSAELARALQLASAGTSTDAVPSTIVSPQALTLSARALPSASSQNFTFTLSGTATLVAAIDPAQLAAAIAGKSRSDAEITLKSFPQVKEAILVLRPFWRSSFPEDPASIKVVVDQPSGN